MTEHEWLTSEDPAAMLRLRRTDCCGCLWTDNGDGTTSLCIGAKPCGLCDNGTTLPCVPWSDRKLRLFACACAIANYGFAHATSARKGGYGIWDATGEADSDDDEQSPICVARSWSRPQSNQLGDEDNITQIEKAAILRDLVGNPFQPVTLPKVAVESPMIPTPVSSTAMPSPTRWHVCPWLTPQALSLAQAAYEERQQDGTLDPFRLLLVADALEEAGATGELLVHLRSPRPHYRGCWVIDLILNKD